ncbi:MAG: RNA-binding cell elongation regulator Jag/EloR [Gaiellaceae bacterium]
MSEPTSDETRPGLTQVEATGKGETSGEAKWAALRELEKLVPSLVKDEVEYEVVAEGERGLLGVGFVESTVVARVQVAEAPTAASAEVDAAVELEPDTTAKVDREPETNEELIAEVLERLCSGLGVECSVNVEASGEGYAATIQGDDLGVVIGRHGQTIDSIQHLAQAVLGRHAGARIPVSVDAADYRARRAKTLTDIAEQAAAEAIETGMEIQLEAMSASERKIIHLHLAERADVETLSEGTEPNRFVVIRTPEPAED